MKKRITLLAGHYGSGKTNIAVNMALKDARSGEYGRIAIADLDIVNPYFRTEDSAGELAAAGVRLICSSYANTNVDLPSMPDDLYAITDDREMRVIVDVGGDDRGALALGRLSGAIKEEGSYEMLMVINKSRPLTRDAEAVMEVMREVEAAGRIPFTGLINNTNLGRDTCAETVLSSLSFAKEVSERSGLDIVFTAAEEAVCGELLRLSEKEGGDHDFGIRGLFSMKLQKRPV